MPSYVIRAPDGKRYRVTSPSSTPSSTSTGTISNPFESQTATDLFRGGGQVIGGLAFSPEATIPGGIGGGLVGEGLRQAASGVYAGLHRQPAPETPIQQLKNVGQAGMNAALMEAFVPFINSAVKGGATGLRAMTTRFPALKAERIRAALRDYHQTQIRDYFAPLYQGIQEQLGQAGSKSVAQLQQQLGELLKRFGVLDEAGEAINESNLGTIQKKVLSIYRSFKQPAGASGLSAKATADITQAVKNQLGGTLGTIPPAYLEEQIAKSLGKTPEEVRAMTAQDPKELLGHLRKLRDMVSDSVQAGRSLSDADNAIGQAASGLISKDLQTISPELGKIDADYADRIQFLHDATSRFHPSSRSVLDTASGENLISRFPKIDTGERTLLKQIEERTGEPILLHSHVNAGAREFSRQVTPFLVGGTTLAATRGNVPSAFVGYFIGRHLAQMAEGLGHTTYGLVGQAPELMRQVEKAGLAGLARRGELPLDVALTAAGHLALTTKSSNDKSVGRDTNR